MRLYLVRHGESTRNAEGRFQGQSDAGLTALGLAQAEAVATALGPLGVDALYSSTAQRTLTMAEAISRQVSREVVPMEGLMELNLGGVDGITGQEMRERFQGLWDTWQKDPSQVTFPGGESLQQLQSRAWDAVQQIVGAHPDGVAVAVSHAFAIGVIVCKLLGLPLSQFQRLQVDLGSITCLEFNDRPPYLVSLNDRCHLSIDHAQEG